jgi:hypothetical protein
MSEPGLPEKILAVHDALSATGIAHAFGGALALAYYAEPRATDDVDINVFAAPESYPVVAGALTPLGVRDELDAAAVRADGQCRLWWGRTPLDLFFAYDELHDAMKRAVRLVPFGDRQIPILAPEHLLICKAIFDRPKDWLDIEQMIVCVEELDEEEIRDWLARIVGENDPRAKRVEAALRSA